MPPASRPYEGHSPAEGTGEAIAGNPELSGGVLWSWADYYHRRQFQSLGAFVPFGVVSVDRRPKAALKALAKAYGGNLDR